MSLQKAKEKRECTFRPSLNAVTQSVGRAAPLDELVNNRRGQRVRERAEAKIRCEGLNTAAVPGRSARLRKTLLFSTEGNSEYRL